MILYLASINVRRNLEKKNGYWKYFNIIINYHNIIMLFLCDLFNLFLFIVLLFI